MARCSRGAEGDVKEFARRLRVIETFGEHSERERLDAGDCFVSRGAVAEHAGQVRDLGNPATVVLELEFDLETEAHEGTLTRPQAAAQQALAADGGSRDHEPPRLMPDVGRTNSERVLATRGSGSR